MKCSPFTRGLRKGGKHMHHHRGRFMKHLMRRCMDGYSSSSSSSSSEDCHRNQIESDSDGHQRMEHGHGMKSTLKHGIGMKHGMRHGHGMMHKMKHGHGMMHKMKHGHGMMHKMKHGHGMMHKMKHDMTHGRRHGMMRHGHEMMHRRGHGHEMMHERGHGNEMMHERGHGHEMMHERGHGHDMMHGRRHGHGMGHWHDRKHGHDVEHRMKHRYGMKHKIHHCHGRKHKMGHGPGMHHKLRYEAGNVCPDDQNEGRVLKVNIENMQDNSESDAFTFYEPKTKAQVMNENNRFQITLETSYYQPEEVSVKIADGKIDVSAMHESMENDIYEFHEMYRSFNIPSNVNPEVISARLDAEGKLNIEAACNDQEESSPTERDIPVIRVSE